VFELEGGADVSELGVVHFAVSDDLVVAVLDGSFGGATVDAIVGFEGVVRFAD
jgi:hypothetical protein